MQDDDPGPDPEKPLPGPLKAPPSLVRELLTTLHGATVRRVNGLLTEAIALSFRVPGRDVALLLSAHPRLARAHLLVDLPRSEATFPLLDGARKHLIGCRVVAVAVSPGGDRLSLWFRNQDDERFGLTLFLTPRPDLMLHHESGPVLYRLRTGSRPDTQAPPPPPASGAARGEQPEVGGTFSSPSGESPSRVLEERYRRLEAAERSRRIRKQARDAVKSRLRSVKRRRGKLENEFARAREGESLRRKGELLTANFHLLKRGQERIDVIDYFQETSPTVTLELDPARTPRENVDALFRRAKKAERALPLIQKKLARAEVEATRLEAARIELSATPDSPELEEASRSPEVILEELIEEGFLPRARPVPARKPKKRDAGKVGAAEPRRFESVDGLEILVGRNDASNDRLIRTLARGEDFWLHAHDVPGSHVIVRLPRGKELPQETLLDAATLAAHFSRARDREKISVLYTRRKYVNKPKGAGPGKVTYSKGSTLYLRMDRERLDRLLGRDIPFAS